MNKRRAPLDRVKRLAERLILSPLMWIAAVLAERVLEMKVQDHRREHRGHDRQAQDAVN